MNKQNKGRLYCIKIIVGLCVPWLLASCTSSNATRTGEINVYKTAPAHVSLDPDHTTGLYVLRGRGFTVSENDFRIKDAFGNYDIVGPTRIQQKLRETQAEALRIVKRFELDNKEEHPVVTRLRAILTELEEIEGQVNEYKSGSKFNNKNIRPLELTFSELVTHLVYAESYFAHLKTDVESIQDSGREHLPESFLSIFEVFGNPLLDKDLNQLIYQDDNNSKWNGVQFVKGTASKLFIELDEDSIDRYSIVLNDHVCSLKELITSNVGGSDQLMSKIEVWSEQLSADYVNFKTLYRSILEDSLNLSYAIQSMKKGTGSNDLTPVVLRKNGMPIEHGDDSIILAGVEERSLDFAYDRIKQNIQKIDLLITKILNSLKMPVREVLFDYPVLVRYQIQTEELIREVLEIANRRPFHPLKPAEDKQKPTHLTIILKTLFLKYLHEGSEWKVPEKRNTELLATCSVLHKNNATTANVYPVLFEQDYAPSHFINRHDRYIYGPAPYHGESLDLRFTVVELDDLGNKSITDGFSSVITAIGSLNPEIAGISPLTSALFGTVIDTATQDDKEMDFSFTLTPPDSEEKSNTDFFVTETGHYILMKKENVYRFEQRKPWLPIKSIIHDEEAGKRQLYRRLIFNPEDFKLYYRRYYHDPKANFKPDNLFMEQSYAVITITDEYTERDNLGDILRKQVSDSLGVARASQFIPTPEIIRDELVRMKLTTGIEETEPVELNDQKVEGLKVAVPKLKDELWMGVSDARKQFIVETLHSRADTATKLALGRDIDKWRRQSIEVDNSGIIRLLRRYEPKVAYINLSRAVESYPVFSNMPKTSGSRYYLRSKSGELITGKSVKLGEIGIEDGVYTPPNITKDEFYLSEPYVNVLVMGERDSKSIEVASKKLMFTVDKIHAKVERVFNEKDEDVKYNPSSKGNYLVDLGDVGVVGADSFVRFKFGQLGDEKVEYKLSIISGKEVASKDGPDAGPSINIDISKIRDGEIDEIIEFITYHRAFEKIVEAGMDADHVITKGSIRVVGKKGE